MLEYLDEIGVPYFLDSHLVRGFDYYGRTVFEIFTEMKEGEEASEEETVKEKKPTKKVTKKKA